MLADIVMDEQRRAENLDHDNQVRPPYVPVAPRNVLVSPMHSKHDTFKPVFSVIWEDVSVLFANFARTDAPLAQYDVLAALEDRGTCILQPKRRVRSVELGQPVFCGNHIHIMRTTDALFKVLEMVYDVADELGWHRDELHLQTDDRAFKRSNECRAARRPARQARRGWHDGDRAADASRSGRRLSARWNRAGGAIRAPAGGRRAAGGVGWEEADRVHGLCRALAGEKTQK
jgi:hypothetical protein